MLMERCMLPENYEYKLINFEPKEGDNYTLSCKIKNMRTENDVKKWLKDYEEKTKFTWRIARTIKSAGRCNIYRLDLRCQHKTDARFRQAKKKSTKNTDCPATLKIVIKRYFDAPKLKKPDEETKMFPCIIDLHNWHNHCPNTPKQLHYPEPTNPFSLPYNECVDTVLIKTETHTSQNTETHTRTSQNTETNTHTSQNTETHTRTSQNTETNTHTSQNTETHTHTSQNTETLTTDVISEQEKENIKRKFEEWYNKVCYGLEHNSEIYFPAVNKMLTNDEKCASTETGLISALHNYAKYEGPRTQSVKYSKRKGKQIAVQPTAIGRRKLSLSGKRKVSAGHPPLT